VSCSRDGCQGPSVSAGFDSPPGLTCDDYCRVSGPTGIEVDDLADIATSAPPSVACPVTVAAVHLCIGISYVDRMRICFKSEKHLSLLPVNRVSNKDMAETAVL